MFRSFRKLPILLVLCLFVLLGPAASALGFGKGASGPDVYVVQAMLKSLGYFPATITGHYGAQTIDAVSKFQAAHGLPVIGAVDDRTLQAILWAYESVKSMK